MDSDQLEEYRKRMQARHQGRSPPVQPSNAPIAPIPAPIAAPQRPSETEDEQFARELQAQEDARVRYANSDEEYARKLQSESERPPANVPPPRNIQREERLVDPHPPPMGYYYNPSPPGPEAARPLLPMNQGAGPVRVPVAVPATSCFPEAEKCCGVSSQRVVLVLAGAAVVAILVALVVLAAES